ncbi:unnamed protein product [Ectocarpus sp. 4 AP-2014]
MCATSRWFRHIRNVWTWWSFVRCGLPSCKTQIAPPEHPAGTTWVWDDGSGVVLKAEGKAKEEIEQRKAEQKEENDGFYDEMESIGQSEWNQQKG